MLSDGAVDTRKHARHAYAQLMHHKKFDVVLKNFLKENERRDVNKILDSMK